MYLSALYNGKGQKARTGERFQKCSPIVLLCCIAHNAFTAEIPLACGEHEQQTIFIEGVNDLECYSYRLDNNRTTFEWTFVQDTGQLDTLATCYGENNCTSYAPSDVTASLFETSCYLSIKPLTSRFSGVVTCTQVNATFRGSANYTVKSKRVSIDDCYQKIDLLEGGDYDDITCLHSPYTPSMVTWTIATHSGQPLHVGHCSMSKNFKSNCTSLLSPDITLTADKTYSSISFGKASDLRDLATVICSVSFPNFTDADNCTLDVYHPATVENCSLDISPYNWSLTFSCDVNRAFDSVENYQFSVYEGFLLLQNGQLMEAEGNLFDGYRFFHQFLVPYINSTAKKLYYRGRVMYTWPLSPYPGTFKSFSFQTYRGGNSQVDFQDGLNISNSHCVMCGWADGHMYSVWKKNNPTQDGLPARPTHNCSDVTTLCSCSTETLGFPAGRLLWLIGNTTVAIGDYGVKELLLPSDNLTNGSDVTVARCQLDWIRTLTCLESAIFYRTREIRTLISCQDLHNNCRKCSLVSGMIALPNSYGDKYKSLAIASWALLCGVVIIDVVVLVILWRLGCLPGHSWKTSPELLEDEDGSSNSNRIKTSHVARVKNKRDEVPATTDSTQTARTVEETMDKTAS